MTTGRERRIFWYTLVLESPPGLYAQFYNRIQPPCSKTHADETSFFMNVFHY